MYVSEIELAIRWFEKLTDSEQDEYKKTIKHPVTEEIKDYIDEQDILLLWKKK